MRAHECVRVSFKFGVQETGGLGKKPRKRVRGFGMSRNSLTLQELSVTR